MWALSKRKVLKLLSNKESMSASLIMTWRLDNWRLWHSTFEDSRDDKESYILGVWRSGQVERFYELWKVWWCLAIRKGWWSLTICLVGTQASSVGNQLESFSTSGQPDNRVKVQLGSKKGNGLIFFAHWHDFFKEVQSSETTMLNPCCS